ncbi:Sec-independent protein translocase protein TatB [Terasakiella sp. A23]|uniref:Sec-independent protein translocase protein TatB n=1 Tax=Terasakiella sp. FCG-A23 TaxID=3080561 RepID=UPI002952B006|nr:Sec-independent protein translocase protein TatB [Terasakiella sp. A23]MDV7338760.1 Sec-independent protein translocase protein TatB [Terasakiella sp. A23]
MLDIGWTEIAVIIVIAILVVGPKDLPKAMRSVAKIVGKVKAMMREFQGNIDEMIKETELEEVKNQISSARTMDWDNKISETVDKDGELSKAMDFSKEAAEFNQSMQDRDKKEEPKEIASSDSAPEAPTDKKS